MNKWKIEFDEGDGVIRTTYHSGNYSEQEVIEFFGLDESDIFWYKVTKLN